MKTKMFSVCSCLYVTTDETVSGRDISTVCSKAWELIISGEIWFFYLLWTHG